MNKCITRTPITAASDCGAQAKLAGGLFVNCLVRGRHHLVPKHPQIAEPNDLAALTGSGGHEENPDSANSSIQIQATRAAVNGFAETRTSSADPGLKEMTAEHE
jgi:hypothetical protein